MQTLPAIEPSTSKVHSAKDPVHPWRDVGLPILVSIAVFCLMNTLWSQTAVGVHLGQFAPVAVYLLSSLVALGFLARALGGGALTAGDLGLAPDAWRPQYRVLGLAFTVGLVAFLYASMPGVVETPRFGDFAFWYFFLLCATMTELLVFLGLGFCLTERWLRDRGWRPVTAVLAAGAFSGVTFGLYHYSHEPRIHPYALPLILVMWMNLTVFVLTRNFQLTFVLHNAVAAVGFTKDQYASTNPPDALNPAALKDGLTLFLLGLAFVVPYLWLHFLEWRLWPRGEPASP
jgi:hypothetical protein